VLLHHFPGPDTTVCLKNIPVRSYRKHFSGKTVEVQKEKEGMQWIQKKRRKTQNGFREKVTFGSHFWLLFRSWPVIWCSVWRLVFFWQTRATLVAGALIGSALTINTAGIDFAMTALFVVIFTEQWENTKNHLPAWIGVMSAVACLLLFGPDRFLIPTMVLIVLLLFFGRKDLQKERFASGQSKEKGGKTI